MASKKQSKAATPATNQPKPQDEFQKKMDGLLHLVTSANQCQSNDDLVEKAVSSVLSNIVGNIKDTSKPRERDGKDGNSHNAKKRKVEIEKEDVIVEDEDDYDDDGDDGDDGADTATSYRKKSLRQPKLKKNEKEESTKEPKWTGPKATIESIEAQEQKLTQDAKKNNKRKANIDFSKQWDKLDDIPLGRVGAKMMVTFGDNIETDPKALQSALEHTRQCLQNAIKDARALKRKMKSDYDRAKVMTNLHRAKRKERSVLKGEGESEAPCSSNVDPYMLFQAIGGYSKIGYEPKCGFDDTQLEKLFPEEMNAYKRWRRMHKAYTDSEGDKKQAQQQHKSNEDDSDEEEELEHEQSSSLKKENEWGGHFNDRLAQFDARTDRMKEEWYMTFAVVRQGSFLSKSFSTENRQWEKDRKGKGKRRGQTNWESLPASYVQFLHWVGFELHSPLPPPNEETTEALAFLGYDFMGKIVEKAIFLRCLEKREKERIRGDPSRSMILELEKREQLTEDDIEKAFGDSTVGAKPLYNATSSVTNQGSAIQLYFGPGFEERIEMELEQMVMGHHKGSELSEAEKKIRLEEDKLFEKLSAPPKKLEGVLDLLDNDQCKDSLTEQRRTDKEKQRAKDKKARNKASKIKR